MDLATIVAGGKRNDGPCRHSPCRLRNGTIELGARSERVRRGGGRDHRGSDSPPVNWVVTELEWARQQAPSLPIPAHTYWEGGGGRGVSQPGEEWGMMTKMKRGELKFALRGAHAGEGSYPLPLGQQARGEHGRAPSWAGHMGTWAGQSADEGERHEQQQQAPHQRRDDETTLGNWEILQFTRGQAA